MAGIRFTTKCNRTHPIVVRSVSVSQICTFCWRQRRKFRDGFLEEIALELLLPPILSHPGHGNIFLTGLHAPPPTCFPSILLTAANMKIRYHPSA